MPMGIYGNVETCSITPPEDHFTPELARIELHGISSTIREKWDCHDGLQIAPELRTISSSSKSCVVIVKEVRYLSIKEEGREDEHWIDNQWWTGAALCRLITANC